MHQGSSLQPRGNGQSFLRVARPNLHRPGRKRSTGCAAPRTNPRRNCRKHKRVFSYSLFGRGSTGFDPAVEGAGSIRPHVRQKTPLAKLTPSLSPLDRRVAMANITAWTNTSWEPAGSVVDGHNRPDAYLNCLYVKKHHPDWYVCIHVDNQVPMDLLSRLAASYPYGPNAVPSTVWAV